MLPWIKLGSICTPDGTVLTLLQHDTDFVIRRGDGKDLMSSRMHGSEEELAALAPAPNRPGARVLVGGLGLGYTLRAALDALPPGGRCTVVELVQGVVDWNRGPLGHLAGHPLDDPRVDLVVADVARVLRETPSSWDSVLLDVDNGPDAFTQAGNDALYTVGGLQRARAALRPGGVLAVWSAWKDRAFERRLSQAGLRVEVHNVRARGLSKGPRHVIYLGRREARPAAARSRG